MRFSIFSLLLCSLVATTAWSKGPLKPLPNSEKVELFAAMESGDIVVKVIPKNATRANLMIENKSGKPLQITLPETFAAVPVLAQFGGGGLGGGGLGGGGLGGGGLGGGGLGGGQQGIGGGLGGGGLGGGGLGGGGLGGGGFGGGGLFNVAPDAVAKVRATTVCLEHGKKDPNPRVAYEIKPIESLNADPRVAEVCRLLGHGKLSQEVAQIMAWHYTDGLSWQELANKIKIKHLNGSVEYYFTRQQVMAASRISSAIEQQIPKPSDVPSPGEQVSAN